jgi:ABC-type lipoprotein export system ATPase subunit
VIVVTHDSRVLQFGDRLLEMADGQIVLDTVPSSHA